MNCKSQEHIMTDNHTLITMTPGIILLMTTHYVTNPIPKKQKTLFIDNRWRSIILNVWTIRAQLFTAVFLLKPKDFWGSSSKTSILSCSIWVRVNAHLNICLFGTFRAVSIRTTAVCYGRKRKWNYPVLFRCWHQYLQHLLMPIWCTQQE